MLLSEKCIVLFLLIFRMLLLMLLISWCIICFVMKGILFVEWKVDNCVFWCVLLFDVWWVIRVGVWFCGCGLWWCGVLRC